MVAVKKSIFIRAPMDRVYALALDPEKRIIWFPGMGELEEQTGEGEVGTVTRYGYEMERAQFTVTHRVVEDHFDPAEARWQGEFDGPLPGEHTWTFMPSGEGTEVTVDLQYTISKEALAAVPIRLFIERSEERNLEFSLDNLMMLSEADSATDSLP